MGKNTEALDLNGVFLKKWEETLELELNSTDMEEGGEEKRIRKRPNTVG